MSMLCPKVFLLKQFLGKKSAGSKPKGLGAEYGSKRAAGDMKKKNAPEPFAYLPLDVRSLNRR